MKEEFSKYDKVVYDGEVFEVLETADRTGMMKLCPLFKASYEYAWADEEMVVSLNRAIKLRIIDEETVDNLTDYSPIGEGLCNTNEWETTDAPFVGKDGSGKNDRVDGKLRWDLLPLAEIEDIVRVYTEGAKKYADNSWQDIPDGFNRYFAASQRHIMEYMKGEKFDKETGCYHLACAAWNIIAMLYYDKHGKGKDMSKNKTFKFIEEASIVHGNRYDYSKSIYNGHDRKLIITCKIHGDFMQTPHNHLNGHGCPKCRYDMNRRLICGVGVNDIYGSKNDRSYNTWCHMIKRCYMKSKKFNAYKDCYVCDEWKIFSNFKKFYDENCHDSTFHLDKDIIFQGNKEYSPQTCVFVPMEINECIKSEWSNNKTLPLGVTKTKYGKYRSRCRIEKGEGETHIGVYENEKEAFYAYREFKKKRLKEMAEKYFNNGLIDKRVYDAILSYEIYPFKYGDKRNDEYDYTSNKHNKGLIEWESQEKE